jgi:hypothetical protein
MGAVKHLKKIKKIKNLKKIKLPSYTDGKLAGTCISVLLSSACLFPLRGALCGIPLAVQFIWPCRDDLVLNELSCTVLGHDGLINAECLINNIYPFHPCDFMCAAL